MTLGLTCFDARAYFTDAEGQEELLADAFGSGDPVYIKNALRTVTQARGVMFVAHATGLTRQQLYRAFAEKGTLRLDTLLKLTSALGFRITIDHKQGAAF
jgi:probable addiction module antidote protein